MHTCRYSQVPPVKKQKKTLNPTQFALSIQAERLSALAQSHHTHTHIHASDATFKTADGGFVAVSNRHSNVRSSSKSFLHNYYEDKYAGLATTRPSYHHLHPCEITPYLHSSLATLSMTCESSMVCEGDGDLLSDALHHPSIGIAGKKYLSYRASDYLTCVLNNGDRYYLTRRDGDATAVSSHTTPPLGSKLSSSSLLSKPMKDLLAEVYEEKRTHELMRLSSSSSSSDGTTASTNPISSDAVDAFRPSTASSALLPHHEQKQQQQSPDLWVDKYSPKSFPQLLSPEKINREVTYISRCIHGG